MDDSIGMQENINITNEIPQVDGERESSSESLLYTRPELNCPYVTPRDQIEQKVAAIWQKLLCIDRVGIYDNFFEIGGDSLNVIEVVNQLRNEFNINIPTYIIFQSPNVSSISSVLRGHPIR